jgi:shikimate kinase
MVRLSEDLEVIETLACSGAAAAGGLVQARNRQADQARRRHDEGQSWLRAKMAETTLSAAYGPVGHVVETVCALAVFGAWTGATPAQIQAAARAAGADEVIAALPDGYGTSVGLCWPRGHSPQTPNAGFARGAQGARRTLAGR